MTQERITMKYIADKLGVSVNTVHKALAGKPGVGEDTRKRIIQYSESVGYQRNESASMLRRRTPKIIAVLPSPDGDGRYFYASLWKGLRLFVASRPLGEISVEAIPFLPGQYASTLSKVGNRLNGGEKIDGLLAFVPEKEDEIQELRSMAAKGVLIELVMGDCKAVSRFGAVVADYHTAGLLMAEQAANLLASPERVDGGQRRVLMLSGSADVDAHRIVAEEFIRGMKNWLPDAQITEIHGAHERLQSVRAEVRGLLRSLRPQFCCSVYAAGSSVLASELRDWQPSERVFAIGSDVFQENADALREGIFENLLYKDPEGLVTRAADMLCRALLHGEKGGVVTGDVELVFRSNLQHYLSFA